MNLTSKLYAREDEFLEYRPYNFFCGTYNVNGKFPDESLRTWLFVNSKKPIDVYAIGFQEIVDLSTTSFLLKSDWLERENFWTEAVNTALNSLNVGGGELKYKFITKIRMYGVFLLVYVNEALANEAVGDVLANYVATGIMDTVGNKGSVAVSVKIFETRVCFVCSHFASDTNKLEKRNADFRSTRQRLRFEYNASGDYYTLDDHDMVFWFGDFNYRVDNIGLAELFKHLNGNELDALVKYDQLVNERASGRVFAGYSEGKINFRPTYKYTIKTDIYECQTNLAASSPNSVAFGAGSVALAQTLAAAGDEAGSEYAGVVGKVKLPSWTDRVLWKSANLKVQLDHYSCVNTLTISDHKPVYALFTVAVKKINPEKFDRIYESLLKESDRRLNEEMPKIAIRGSYEFKFGACSFYDTKSLRLEVVNEGHSRANIDIHFYDEKMLSSINKPPPPPDEDEQVALATGRANYSSGVGHAGGPGRSHGQWVKVSPAHIERLEPSAHTHVELTVDISKHVLPRLHASLGADDFLVLRCMNGNDLFATVSLEYRPSVMGISLRGLSTLKATEESFESRDKRDFIERVERPIAAFEAELDRVWVTRLRQISSEKENQAAQKILLQQVDSSSLTYEQYIQALNELTLKGGAGSATTSTVAETSAASVSVQASKIELYNMCLANLSKEIIENDAHFHNDLSAEYDFFLGHLVKRVEAELALPDADAAGLDDSSGAASGGESGALAGLTVEAQKALLLSHLSSRSFEALEKAGFEVELMAEVLYDLLYTLPSPLVPARYFDYCVYSSASYDDAIKIFGYLPRSHLKLFELVVKFLQLYLKRLRTPPSDSATTGLIADALFQVKTSSSSSFASASSSSQLRRQSEGGLSYQSQTARKFLATFIDNHKQFLAI